MDQGAVSNCNFTNNTANGDGGAVYFLSTGNVTNCNFVNNSATGEYSCGGAVFFISGNVTSCSFNNNQVNGNYSRGGAIYFDLYYNTVTNCNFSNNTARYGGGAVYFDRDSSGNVENSIFADNEVTGSDGRGGAIYFVDKGNVTKSRFTSNKARYGAAIRFDAKGDVANCNFSYNFAYYDGGAVYFYREGNVANCKFASNFAAHYGGAVYIDSAGNLINCKFEYNKAAGKSGAIYGYRFSYARADSCIFKAESDEYVNTDIFSPTLTVDDFTSTYGSGEKLTFELKTYSGIPIYDGNITISLYTSWGEWICDYACLSSESWVVDLQAGSYYVYFDTEYEQFYSVRKEITIIKASSDLDISDNTLTLDYGTSTNVTVTTQNATGITAKINDENIEVIGNTVMIPVLDAGTYLLTVTTLTDSNHSSITKKAIIFVSKLKTELTADSITVNYNSNESLIITLKDVRAKPLFGQLLLIDFNGAKTFDLTDFDGTVKVSVKGWPANTYNVKIVFMENNNYKGSNATATVTINNIIPLCVDDVSVSYGDAAEIIVVTSPVINNQNITITVNGTSKNATVKDGIAKAIFEGLSVNEYEILVNYSGSQYNLANSTTAKLTVNKANSTLEIGDITFDYGGSGSTSVKFTGATKINASIINQPNATINVTNNTITISGLDVGTYTLTVTTIADRNHNNITKNATVTVNKLKTQIDANSVTTTYNINKDLVVTLTDNTSKPLSGAKITVDLNGVKTYTTDNNGQIKISTRGLSPKTYTAKITFNGNTVYEKSTKDIKITVNKATPKIIAKKKTYKAKKKTKKFTIILKDNTGKPIKNAKVRLIVKKIAKKSKKKSSNKKSKSNNKKYFVKTNSKGQATFKILKNKKGKYTAKVNFYGDSYYNKASQTVKIVIK